MKYNLSIKCVSLFLISTSIMAMTSDLGGSIKTLGQKLTALEKSLKTPPKRTTEGKTVWQVHKEIQDEFIQILKSEGMSVPQMRKAPTGPRSDRFGIKRVGKQLKGQVQFNTIRAELNDLLQQKPINKKAIENKITELRKGNPARWPRAENYVRVLREKVKSTSAKKTTQPKKPVVSTRQKKIKSPGQIQNEFVEIQKSAGLTPPKPFRGQTSRRVKERMVIKGQVDRRGYPLKKVGRQPRIGQRGYDRYRQQLNNLLQEKDIQEKKIRDLIEEFRKKKPARWPQPEDYEKVLNKKLGK